MDQFDRAQEQELADWERLQREAIQPAPVQASAEFCEECEEPIPPARQRAVPGVQLCVLCQNRREKYNKQKGGR